MLGGCFLPSMGDSGPRPDTEPHSLGNNSQNGNMAWLHLPSVTAPSGWRQSAPGSQGALKVCNIFDEGNSDCNKIKKITFSD